MSIQLPPQQLNPYGMLQAGRSKNAGGIGLATKGKIMLKRVSAN